MNKVCLFFILFVCFFCEPLFSQKSLTASELADSVLINDSLANYYNEKGNHKKAIEFAAKNVAINSLLGKNTVSYAISILKLARYINPNERDYEKKLINEGLTILKDSLGVKSSTYTMFLLEYAWRLFNNDQIQEACNILKGAVEENYVGEEFYLGYLYYSYAHFLVNDQEKKYAKIYAMKAESFFEEKEMYSNGYYSQALRDLAFLSLPDIDEGIKYLNKAKDNIEQYKGRDCLEYLDVILDYAYIYEPIGQLDKALDYAKQAKTIGEKIKDIDYSSYLYTLEYLAKIYSDLKEYDKAIVNAEECLMLMKERKDIAIIDRLPTIDSLIVYNWYISNIEKSNLYAKEAYLLRKNLNISGDDLVKNLYYLLHSNFYLGKYEECEVNVNETKTILGDTYTINYRHYYDDMEVLMHSFFKRKLYKEALNTSNEIVTNYMIKFGKENEYLASIVKNQAIIYSYLGNMEKYHDYSIKALEITKNSSGRNSPKYLSDLSALANNFYNLGFLDESYEMYKEATNIANIVYGKKHVYFVENYLLTMQLWDKNKNVINEEYRLEDLYKFIVFQKIIWSINSFKKDSSSGIVEIMNSYLRAALPNLIYKYGVNATTNNILYNCLLLQKAKSLNLTEFKIQIQNELGKNHQQLYDDLCNSNSAYIMAQFNSSPVVVDSLYNVINQYIDIISKNSLSFDNYIRGEITVEKIKNNLYDDEIVIDYVPRAHIEDGWVDYLVVLDKKCMYPDYVALTNASEQIRKICDSYNTVYFFVDNDSILSILNIDRNSSNFFIGYDLSINHIINRSSKSKITIHDSVIHKEREGVLDAFSSAYDVFDKGVNYYNAKQYERAIEAFFQCDSLMYFAKGEDSNFFGHGLHWIASCYHQMGMDSIAEQYSNYYNFTPINMKLTIQSDSILDVADSLYNKGEIESSLQKYIEASEIEKRNLGRDNYWYANTLSHCAEICNKIGKNEKAIELETNALDIRKKSLGINHVDYYWSLKNLYYSYSALDLTDEKIYYGDMIVQFMENHKEELGKEYLFYPIYTLKLAILNNEKENIIEADSYITKTINSADLLLDDPSAYMSLHYNMIYCLKAMGNDNLSFELCKRIIPFYEKNKDKQVASNEFFEILNIVANHYINQDDYISASVYQERALVEIKDKKSESYGKALSNLALTYRELDRIEESIKYAEEAVALSDTTQNISEYALRLMNLAHCYAHANRPKDALRCGKTCYSILKEKYGINNRLTLLAGNNLAAYYNHLGYHEEFEKLLFLVIESAEKEKQKNGDILSSAYNNLAMDPLRKTDNLEYINKSYEIRKTIYGENNRYTIQSLYNKGLCLIDLNYVTEGVECINLALNQTKDLIGVNNLRYIEMMEMLSTIYGCSGNLKRALETEEERNMLIKGMVDESHPAYLKSLDNLSELYFFTNDTLKLYKTIIDESNYFRKMIISNFPNYTSVERANVVNDMVRFYDWIFPLVCYYKKQPNLCAELYNSRLLRKGLLLNSEIEFSRLIRESGDSVLIRHYNELIVNKNLLNKQYQLPIDQRGFDLDSLRHAINEEEDYLISSSKEYGDFTRRFSYNWKDIKDKLNDDELSIEFLVFNDTCAIQNKIYYALIINRYSDSPELIPLCMETQIQDAFNGDNKTEDLYQLIWNPILKKHKIKKIYFSPSGILNNIGIEYIDINDHDNISDKYTIIRLSSTREIIEKRGLSYTTAVLYGGLDYSVDTDIILAQNRKSGIESSSSLMYRGLSDSLSSRNSFEPLYNTKNEISEIGKTLKKREMSVTIYSDVYGTEESFKKMSGKAMNIIHIATHGMYIGASEADSKKKSANLSFIQLDEHDNGLIQEDKSLTRSFLVMSGGDMLPSHKIIPDNMEDGILTALEISKMDLRGLDLVVLSACQTALGDVDNEGVYGLQRGFKKAGANTILMSLDKVDDEATKILMVEFYRNLMSGKTKHQSLKDAQKYLRQVDNGKYDEPKYWASFIMLDGLN